MIKGVGNERNLGHPCVAGKGAKHSPDCNCVPGTIGREMRHFYPIVVSVFRMGYNIRNVSHRDSVILFFCMLVATDFIIFICL